MRRTWRGCYVRSRTRRVPDPRAGRFAAVSPNQTTITTAAVGSVTYTGPPWLSRRSS
ncbi:hypothetical protein ACFFX0_16490 [Citricoccus parietis]|uniref:Uncharacterized protein n=1 Tax=Citricoccus parietis TaxID=592307 RepID=A0ABV5G1A5_9MICC